MSSKKILTSELEYFDKALNGGFKEAQNNPIYWEEEKSHFAAKMSLEEVQFDEYKHGAKYGLHTTAVSVH